MRKIILTPEQAKTLIVEAKTVHCFANPNGMLIGADWDLNQVHEYFDSAEQIEIAGKAAKASNHAIAVFGKDGLRFFESNPEKVEQFENTTENHNSNNKQEGDDAISK